MSPDASGGSSRHRRAPRPLAAAVARLGEQLAPATALARVQACWQSAVGEAIAAAARPTAEHGGVLTVSCEASVWAQELDLMGPQLVDKLNAALGSEEIKSLRCRMG